MKTIKKYFLFTVLSLILGSCGKEKMIKISAVNPITGEAYPNLPFKIVSGNSGMFETKYKTEYEGTLDANGISIFPFNVKKSRFYDIGFGTNAPENSCYTNKITYTFAIQDESFDFAFEYAPCSSLKLKINNVNCEGPADNFKLFHYGSDIDYHDYAHGNPIIEGDGCYSYEGVTYSDVPMGGRYYRWEVTRSAGTEIFYDTLYLNGGEFKTYEINY